MDNVLSGFRLSPQQRRLWSLAAGDAGGGFQTRGALRIDGELDTEALRRAVRRAVGRHESLRTTFHLVPGLAMPLQVPTEAGQAGVRWEPDRDLSGLDPRTRETVLGSMRLEPARFDLERGPLVEASLVKLAPELHLLRWVSPALAADGPSFERLAAEIAALYGAEHGSGDEPGEVLQYVDVAEWQNEALATESTEKARAQWRRLDLAELADLRWPAGAEAGSSFEPVVLTLRLPAALAARLGELADRHQARPADLFLGAWLLLVSRLAGRSGLAMGLVCDGRVLEELRGVVGALSKVVPMPVTLDGTARVGDWLAEVRRAADEARENQDLFLWEDLEGGVPFLPFCFESESPAIHRAAGAAFAADGVLAPADRFLAKLHVAHRRGAWEAELHYDRGALDGVAAVRLGERLVHLLEHLAAHPEQAAGELEPLTPAERHALLVEWNDTLEGLAPASLHELVARQAARQPDRLAVRWDGGSWTLAELLSRARRLACHLRSLGVGPEVVVGVHLERSPEMVVALLAVLEAGGAYLPLDPDYPAERLGFMLADARPRVILTEARRAATLPTGGARVVAMDRDAASFADLESGLLSAGVGLDGLDGAAYVIYTSGSTGRPKGVVVPHDAIANRLLWMQRAFPLAADDRLLQKTPFSFDASLWEIFVPLLTGAELFLARPGGQRDAAYMAREVAERGITVLQLVPSLLRVFLEEPGLERCVSLCRVFCGGEALPLELQRRFHARLPWARLHILYGPTEMAIDVTAWECDPEDGEPGPRLGRPIANDQVHLLDAAGRLVPAEVAGELLGGGAGLARGYLGRPGLTAERFVPDPFGGQRGEPGARLYRTGDLARRLGDGSLVFCGRVDHQVKMRGFRVELGEIETVLEELPAVSAAVAGVWEEAPGASRLVAWFVPAPGQSPAVAELRAWMRARCPEPMVPDLFVPLGSLPMTPSGKVDRAALPAPSAAAPEEDGSAPAATPLEEILAGIWGQVLGLERVGLNTGFFDLGGHSLLASQVVSRVRQTFNVELPLRKLFEAPTVSGLAAEIQDALREGRGVQTPPLVPVPRREQGMPLSFPQQRLWFLDQLDPGETAYNIPLAVRLDGWLAPAVLEASLGEVVCRHEALRTVFASLDGEPVQRVEPPAAWRLPLVDLVALPEASRDAEARRLAAADTGLSFDLARGPLLRLMLARLAGDEHRLLGTVHHIVADAWSIERMVSELSALYGAFAAGRLSPLPELPVQYADFASWQRLCLSDQALAAELAYWKERLDGAPQLLSLPTDRPRPPIQSPRGANRPVLWQAGLVDGLRELARREGVTLFMTLLAGFQSLLGRYSGQQDINVGTPMAARTHVEIEELVGFFANTLVLRGDLSGGPLGGPPEGPAARELLARAREAVLEAHLHQSVPFEKLVEELQPDRDPSYSPLFQAMLALRNVTRQTLSAAGLTMTPLDVETGTAKFDLTLALSEQGGELTGLLEYGADLFDAATMDRLLGHLARLLEGMAAAPAAPVAELPLLSPEELEQLLREWHDGVAPAPPDACIHHLFESWARRIPEAPAALFGAERLTYGELDAAANRLTYGELDAAANRLAHHLVAFGVGPEVPVALCLERGLGMVVSVLGVLKAGGAFVMLDPSYPLDRLELMLDDSGCPILITEDRAAESLPAHHAFVINLDSPADRAFIETQPADDPGSDVLPDNLAYLLYTSGSTGRPKGVQVPHRGLVSLAASQVSELGVGPEDRVLQFASLSFDASVFELVMALASGAALVLAPRESLLPGPELARVMREQRVSHVTLPPSSLAVMSDPGLADLRMVTVAGEACSAEVVDAWAIDRGQSRRFFNLYGPTEATIWSSLERCEPGGGTPAIGRSIPHVRLQVLDAHQRHVPVGVPGQLYIGGVGVTRGYVQRPDLTAERFVPDPASSRPGERLYASGDLVRRRADGRLEFLGRIDHQVKVRGFRIEPGEVEAVLRRHGGVREAVVLARDGAGGKSLVAYVAADAPAPEPAVLRAFVAGVLPDYMVPSAVVVLPALPLTASGKVDRRALPAPEEALEERTGGGAPRNPVEELLAGIFAEVLGREVGVEESFFDAGGHSLLVTQVISRVRKALGFDLPLRAFFEAPTVAGLAGPVSRALRGGPPEPPIEPADRSAGLPLSFPQQRLWFLEQLEEGATSLNIPSGVRFAGSLDTAALHRALSEVVRRHESLRARFPAEQGRPRQEIAPFSPPALPEIDLAALPEPWRQREMESLLRQETRRPFDLAAGPLLRTALFRLATEERVLLLVLHHIVSDGWSMGVLVREVAELYRAATQRRPPVLPELPVQYVDFAAWQRRWLTGEVLDSLTAYWGEQLGGRLPVLELPADQPRSVERARARARRGATEWITLPADLSRDLKALARREGATLFMVLLAAYQAWLRSEIGDGAPGQVVVGTDVANRNRLETEPLIGFFVNQLVLRTDLSGDPTWLELLGRAREVAMKAFAHQDMPFDHLVEMLKIERTLRHAPLFQVKLIVQNAPVPPLELPGLTLSPLELDQGTALLDLTVALWETPEGVSGWYNYDADLFEPEAMRRRIGRFERVLAHLAAYPDARLSDLRRALGELAARDQSLEAEELARASFQKFTAFRPKSHDRGAASNGVDR